MKLSKEQAKEAKLQEKRFRVSASRLMQRLSDIRQGNFRDIVETCPDSQCLQRVLPAYLELVHHADKIMETVGMELQRCINLQVEQPNKINYLARCYNMFEYAMDHEINEMASWIDIKTRDSHLE